MLRPGDPVMRNTALISPVFFFFLQINYDLAKTNKIVCSVRKLFSRPSTELHNPRWFVYQLFKLEKRIVNLKLAYPTASSKNVLGILVTFTFIKL